MQKVGSINVDCNIQLNWMQPESEEPIINYKVEIFGLRDFQILENCGNEAEITCSIPVFDLLNEPYNLPWGSSVTVRATAITENG